MRVELELTVNRLNREPEKIVFNAKRMFNAGWVGSDRQALQHHIDELADVGVAAPKHIPTLLALGNHLLTHSRHIQVHGPQTSGEVEWVLLWHHGEILVTVGSDHTDRKLESVSVAKSKNMCLNVIARDLWPYEEVKDHFDQLRAALHGHPQRDGVALPGGSSAGRSCPRNTGSKIFTSVWEGSRTAWCSFRERSARWRAWSPATDMTFSCTTRF